MQRTRRDSHFDGQVRRAMIRREDHGATHRDPATAVDARRGGVGEQMARWETEGGALGDATARRPRSTP